MIGQVSTRHQRGGWIPATAIAVLLLPHVGATSGGHDGELDPTFGGGGTVTTNVGGLSQDWARAVALQEEDGKIIAGGRSAGGFGSGRGVDFLLIRYESDGALDPGFGTDGIVLTDFGNSARDEVAAVLRQPDGTIVAVGTTSTGRSRFALARYLPDGSLDASFGSGGKVTTEIGTVSDMAVAADIQPDGKIVVVGTTTVNSANTSHDFALVRYNPNGSLDTSFGSGGKVTTNIGMSDQAAAVDIQPNGRIVVVGTRASFTGTNDDIALARYNPNGSLDASFGVGGRVVTDFANAFDRAAGIAIQEDGRIVVSGSTNDRITATRWALTRYATDGSLDPSFGVGGRVVTPVSSGNGTDLPGSLAIQLDGRIVVAGTVDHDFAVGRYLGNGALDPTFGSGGLTITDFGQTQDRAEAIGLQHDGQIVVVGITSVGVEFDGIDDVALARYEGGLN